MKTAWLYPGQGSQFCGMGRDLWATFSPAREVLEMAESLCECPLGEYSLRGPAATLTRTDVLQPAVTAMNIGCTLLLRDAGYQPDMVAGHSLGEFSALFAAGVLTAEETLRLVIERGRAMNLAAEQSRGGMLALKGLTDAQTEALVAEAGAGEVCVANYNSPDQIVVSGTTDGLKRFAHAVRAAGALCIELPVAGAWHSSAMKSAAEAFERELDKVRLRDANCPVYLNTTGEPETDAGRIGASLRKQMLSPVRWRYIVEGMRTADAGTFLEVGPGKVLRGLLRRICPDEQQYVVRGIDGPRSLGFLHPQTVAAVA